MSKTTIYNLQDNHEMNGSEMAANAYKKGETIIAYRNLQIHPDRFSILDNEQISSTQVACKSYNHENFVMTTLTNNKVEVIDKFGNLKYSFYGGGGLVKLSSNGEFIHQDYETDAIYGDGSYTIKTFFKGKLIFQTDSIRSYKFNRDNNVLVYVKTSEIGIMHYRNFYTDKNWENKISEDQLFTSHISENGESFIVYSLDSLFALNNNGEVLWSKSRGYFIHNISLSDHGKYLMYEDDNDLELYSFANLEIARSKPYLEITDSFNGTMAFCQDERKLIYALYGKGIRVFNFEGELMKELPIDINYFFNVIEVNGFIHFVYYGKKHFIYKIEEIIK